MVQDGQPTLVAMVYSRPDQKGLHAGNIAREAAQVMEGGGGGQPEIAQAGEREPISWNEPFLR